MILPAKTPGEEWQLLPRGDMKIRKTLVANAVAKVEVAINEEVWALGRASVLHHAGIVKFY